MSGIVGIIHLDGMAVDRALLRRMTASLAYRGPHAQTVWTEGPVGLGHAMLRTTFETIGEKQPWSLDGQVWIVADARMDGRKGLTRKLASLGRGVSQTETDAGLILQAYSAWGEACVEHLLGDFAFAIWDARRRRLLCARDQFGVKPFYYACVGRTLILSNTLDCLRLHPDVSDELNDLGVADFLLFGFNQEVSTTTFADLQRLPPAHVLSCSLAWPRMNVRRYWTLPTDGHVRYRRASEYVDHFRDLLVAAVEDRLRADRVGVFMSGGLDSAGVTAIAKKVLLRDSARFELRAHTMVYDRLIPDRERHYAALVARSLGIPIQYFAADDYQLYEGFEDGALYSPEPTDIPLAAVATDHFRLVATQSRVVLSGDGGDPVLYPSLAYFLGLLRRMRLDRIVTGFVPSLLLRHRIPRIGLRGWMKQSLGISRPRAATFPPWLNRALSARLDLPARWEQLNRKPVHVHSRRPEAYNILLGPYWPYVFESENAGVTRASCEVRYPFFDLRVVNYLLAIPPLPWCLDKEILRRALRGALPEAVRCRPKTPLAGDPTLELLRRPEAAWLNNFSPVPELARYVIRNKIPPIESRMAPEEIWTNLRPLHLNFWLRHQTSLKYKFAQEGRCETPRAAVNEEAL